MLQPKRESISCEKWLTSEAWIRKVERGRLGRTSSLDSRNLEASSSKPPALKLFLGSFQTPPVPERNQKSLQRTPTSKHKRLAGTGRAPVNSYRPPGLFMRRLRHYKQLFFVCVNCTRKGAGEQDKSKETWLEKTPKHVKMKKLYNAWSGRQPVLRSPFPPRSALGSLARQGWKQKMSLTSTVIYPGLLLMLQ